MKKHVLFIHGAGEGAYEADKKLAASLQHSLGPEYDVHCPAMPDEENAPYEQWKRQIEKELATMSEPVILVGHSVGASIVVKCLSEIEVEKPISVTFLGLLGSTLAGSIVWAAVTLSSVVMIQPSTRLSLLLGVCGGLFLIRMGWGAVRDSWRKPVPLAMEPSGRAALLSGVLLSLANPFTAVFWLSIAGSLLSVNALTAPLPAAVTIVSAFVLATLIWSLLLASIASYGRRLVRATAFRWLNAGAGVGMVLFGFGLFWQTLAAL